ncbi:hypothetical protein [Saccharibacillus sacchari]|uniref:hypothetical protein n=1 Tax=Saccharibacillus sacchari TaxID=456493 RepID=UPI0012EC3CA8|nr:hypothetical protein [Saccharibacillus sacchari]
MSNARSFMVLAAVFFLFIGACTYTVNVIQSIEHGTRLAYALKTDQDRKVKAKLSAPGEETYSGAAIVNIIRNIQESDLDIEVNGMLYLRTGNYEDFDPSRIDLSKRYRAIYERDSAGYLIKIVFRG